VLILLTPLLVGSRSLKGNPCPLGRKPCAVILGSGTSALLLVCHLVIVRYLLLARFWVILANKQEALFTLGLSRRCLGVGP
jgi:hypothetical protein